MLLSLICHKFRARKASVLMSENHVTPCGCITHVNSGPKQFERTIHQKATIRAHHAQDTNTLENVNQRKSTRRSMTSDTKTQTSNAKPQEVCTRCSRCGHPNVQNSKSQSTRSLTLVFAQTPRTRAWCVFGQRLQDRLRQLNECAAEQIPEPRHSESHSESLRFVCALADSKDGQMQNVRNPTNQLLDFSQLKWGACDTYDFQRRRFRPKAQRLMSYCSTLLALIKHTELPQSMPLFILLTSTRRRLIHSLDSRNRPPRQSLCRLLPSRSHFCHRTRDQIAVSPKCPRRRLSRDRQTRSKVRYGPCEPSRWWSEWVIARANAGRQLSRKISRKGVRTFLLSNVLVRSSVRRSSFRTPTQARLAVLEVCTEA